MNNLIIRDFIVQCLLMDKREVEKLIQLKDLTIKFNKRGNTQSLT